MKLSSLSPPRVVTQSTLVAFFKCAALVALAVLLFGCGNTLYLVQVTNAEEAFEEARELGAEQYSPYEYYAARARLEEAKMQAAQAEYGNASDLSDEAIEFAERAIENSKKAQNLSVAPPTPRPSASRGATE